MAKQPEQILEEQLVAQIKAWDVYLEIMETTCILNLLIQNIGVKISFRLRIK